MITELLLTSALLGGAGGPQGLADFAARLQSYLDVRRVAAQTVSPLAVTNDRAVTIATTDALAAAISRARDGARHGDIFTPPIAAAVRAAVASGCANRFDELRRDVAEETTVPLPPPAINGRWPIGAPLPTMPPDVLEALPPLPAGLEYRFMGRALALRDIDANLIVDFVDDAIPSGDDVSPARLAVASLPALPAAMLGGGQVFLELTVDTDGRVADVKTLRASAPLTSLVADAVRGWRFDPSQKTVETVGESQRLSFRMARVSKVFVGAVFRAPTLGAPTLGAVPVDTAAPVSETPFPVTVTPPAFPPMAFGAGVVLVELAIESDGSVSEVCVVESAPPFDRAALDAARQFRFRPARIDGAAVPSFAYVLFGFPLPITHESSR